MRNLILYAVLAFLVTAGNLYSQTGGPCDSLDILKIEYAPFNDSLIAVYVINNNSTTIFDYPGFILFDANGDTVAKETVNYFGIGNNEQVHMMRIKDGIQVQENFSGTLELWTNFYTSLACSYSLMVNLCPDTTCRELFISLGNFGGALAIETFDWEIKDLSGNTVHTGTMELTANQQMDKDSVCLDLGNYVVEITSATQPMGQVFYSTYVGNQNPSGPSGQYFYNSTVFNLDFFEACSGTNSIDNPGLYDHIQVFVRNDVLFVNNLNGKPLGLIKIFDAAGRMVIEKDVRYNHTEIDLNRYPSMGFYLLNLIHQEQSFSKKFVK